MAKLIIILLLGLVCEAIGVVYLKQGLHNLDEDQEVSVSAVKRVILKGVTSGKIWTGIFFEALFFASLLYLIANASVSFVWPLTALGFVFTTFAAKMFLHEKVSGARWLGVSLIVLGAAIISWTEHRKTGATAATPPQEHSSEERPAD